MQLNLISLNSIFTILLGLFVFLLIIGRLISNLQFKYDIKQLFKNSENLSHKTFNFQQLESLPIVVQNYFKHVLKEGQPYISKVKLKHKGRFKTGKDKKWSAIKGKQYFSAWKPGFIWEGRIAGIVSARDKYLNDKGSLTIKLLDVFKISEGKGSTFDQGELLRWLGESVWFPTNLLPSERLTWEPVDDNSAKLIFNYNDLNIFYIVTFNEQHELVKFETRRYMDASTLKPWFGECSNYQEVEGVKVPFNIKASWKLDDGDFNYVDFYITDFNSM